MSSLYTQMMDAVTELQQQQRLKPGGVMVVGQNIAAPASSSPIEQSIRRLENEIAVLSESLESLYVRLNPYLQQVDGKQPHAYPPQPIIGTSLAVAKVSELTERLSRMCCELASVKERLEL